MDSSGHREAGYFSRERKTATLSVPSEIAQNLKVADEDASFKYDESARNFVAEKPVLAYILKSALDEYADCTIQEIAEKFIEGPPEIKRTAVHQDHPNKKDGSKMMSGDDSEESFHERIKEDLAEFEREYASKDWTFLTDFVPIVGFSKSSFIWRS